MKEAISEQDIVYTVAREAAERLTRKVIADLQKIKHTLTGDDSELETAWDDICVDIQLEKSLGWDVLDETVRMIVRDYASELPIHEKQAIWLQSEAGIDWYYEEPDNREPSPEIDSAVVGYITEKYVYAKADDWSNSRIRAYIGRYYP